VNRLSSILTSLTLAITVSACSLFTSVKSPDLALTNLEPSDVTLFSTKLKARVRVENEDAQPLEISGAVLRLYINGDYVGKGMGQVDVVVPAYGSAEFELPINVSNLSMVSNVQGWVDGSSFDYKLQGHLDLAGGGVFGKSVNVEIAESFEVD
jgi:LEA14-like dessication related protein